MDAKTLQIGPRTADDNDIIFARGDRLGDQVFAAFVQEQTARGNAYVATTATALSLTALGDSIPTLWNPSDSGKAVILSKVAVGAAAVGTAVMTAIVYGVEAHMGAETHATDGAIKTFTNVAPTNCLIGSQASSRTKWAPATCTFTTAPTQLTPSGFSQSATVSTFGNQSDMIDGRIMLLPGTVFQVGATTTSSTTFHVSIWFLEVDLRYAL